MRTVNPSPVSRQVGLTCQLGQAHGLETQNLKARKDAGDQLDQLLTKYRHPLPLTSLHAAMSPKPQVSPSQNTSDDHLKTPGKSK